MDVFVGDERAALVAELRAAFDETVAAERVRLVCLLAETGWGKTRIVQELYRELQRGQPADRAYWPPDLVAGSDPVEHRKVVYPRNPRPPEGVSMPWLWWGVSCERRASGRPLGALFADHVQVRENLRALVEVATRRAGDRDLLLGTLGEAVGLVPGVGTVLAGLKVASKWAKRLRDGLQRRQERQRGSVDRAEGVGVRVQVEPELELLRRFVSPELPLVLVVDDAHEADPVTVAFLRELLQLSIPALVVCTAWPSTVEDQAVDEAAVPLAERVTFGGLLAAMAEEGRAERRVLQPLAPEELRQLVGVAAPRTTADRVDALLEVSSGNPLVLGL